MIDAVTIKLAYVLTRSCVISGRRLAMMTRVHEIMRGQDGIIRISQNQNRTSSIVLQKKVCGKNQSRVENTSYFFVGQLTV